MASGVLPSAVEAAVAEKELRLSPLVGGEMLEVKTVQYVPEVEREWRIPLQLPEGARRVQTAEMLWVPGSGGVAE